MRFRNRLISSAVAAALGTAGPIVALAQSADQSGQATKPAQAAQLEEVVVTGIRASLENAQELKKNSDTIQDSIVADDIGKLPDVTAVEALQRITGVQIGRDLGEGGGTVSIGGSSVNSGIEIRGLPQVETTLNGREVFSASGSRVLNFEDIPSSLLAGIDVYKDPTADLLEGGIGGTVDLRTRKPFDFKGLELEGSAAERYGDLVSAARPEFTALASNRWQTGIGDVGALISFGYSDRAYREDQVTGNGVLNSTTIVPGQTSTLIPGAYNTMFNGERKRTGLDGVLQWQPADDLTTYVEASSQELSSKQNQYSFTSLDAGTPNPIPGSVTFFPGTTDANSVQYSNAQVGSVGAWRALIDVNRQIAMNAKWTPGQFTVIGDVSYTTGTESLNNPAVLAGSIAPVLSQTASISGVTNSQVTGVDLTNLANYGGPGTTSYMYDTQQNFRGEEKAFRLDGQYAFQGGFLSSLDAGLRFADRTADFHQASMFGYLPTGSLQANAGWFGLMPGNPLFSKTESTLVQPNYIVFNPNQLHYNLAGVENAFGLPAASDNGTADYTADEKNYSGFVRADFAWDTVIPIDGNVGVRVVRHSDTLNGEVATAGVYTPATFTPSETDTLPSLNLRFKLLENLQLRLAASKAVTYPDFTQIRPSQTLNPAQGAASGGNPNLKPTKANQVDGSLEWYLSSASSVTADVFFKKLTDFVLTQTQQAAFTQNGITYNLTGATNGPSGTIKGLEVGYQQFLDFLPSWWSGIGYQANYTYVDAQAPTAVVGTTTTLPGLSKNAFNLIGIYEKGPISFRVAYSWRSQFYTSIYSGSTATLAANPIYTKQFGWLDASLNYELTHQWSVYAQGSNLMRTRISTFYGAQTIPDARTIDDRQALLGVRFKFN
jgi:iron complex outermembrane receptor protein